MCSMTEETKLTLIEEEYLKSLTEKEYQAYLIAKNHLGSLFTISKTSGFLKWMKEQTHP